MRASVIRVLVCAVAFSCLPWDVCALASLHGADRTSSASYAQFYENKKPKPLVSASIPNVIPGKVNLEPLWIRAWSVCRAHADSPEKIFLQALLFGGFAFGAHAP